MTLSSMQLARSIDHTLLKPEAREAQVLQLCQEAKDHGFAAVCVHPCHVALCAQALQGSEVCVATVIGFPLGMTTSEVKAFEAEQALAGGARELDMVINIGALKDGKKLLVQRDIEGVVAKARVYQGACVKVIIEACLLTETEKIAATQAVIAAGADYVKTSTGFSTGGATEADVRLLSEIAGSAIKVKAAGGIRNREEAERMLTAGAQRIGTSQGLAIIKA